MGLMWIQGMAMDKSLLVEFAAPQFVIPSSLDDWKSRRGVIKSQLQKLLGDLPVRPVSPTISGVKREDKNSYYLEKFSIGNGAGAEIPAYLLLPKKASKANPVPAILYCHWHGGEYDIGKEELFRNDHTPAVPAIEFVERGYAVLAIDAYCFGERNGVGPAGATEKGSSGEMTASKYNLWLGRSLWGMILRDDLIALDVLAARPEIDPNRIGATGISMGATRTWWLMALDERIKSGVAVACLTRYEDLISRQGLKYHGIYYFVPGILKHFDTEAIVSLAAPRPLLCMNGDQDDGTPVSGVRIIESAVTSIYELYGKKANYVSRIYPNTGHKYLPEMWVSMLEWFGRDLKP